MLLIILFFIFLFILLHQYFNLYLYKIYLELLLVIIRYNIEKHQIED